MKKTFLILLLAAPLIVGSGMPENKKDLIELFNAELGKDEMVEKIQLSDSEWKERLEPNIFEITRQKGTERAFTGEYYNSKGKGIYECVLCGTDLYASKAKFDSGTGWPSFTEPVDSRNISTKEDNSFFMKRTELLCSRCGSHLGHVFDDGPSPTYKRHCINSASLKFISGEF